MHVPRVLWITVSLYKRFAKSIVWESLRVQRDTSHASTYANFGVSTRSATGVVSSLQDAYPKLQVNGKRARSLRMTVLIQTVLMATSSLSLLRGLRSRQHVRRMHRSTRRGTELTAALVLPRPNHPGLTQIASVQGHLPSHAVWLGSSLPFRASQLA